jgi:quercetin dioxygenase-like cupin family protein
MAVIKRKISLKEGKVDKSLSPEEGWVKTIPVWLVTEEVGAKYGTFGYAELPSGSIHELHTHPNADEVFYVISGHGIAKSGDEEFEISAGDTVFVPCGEPHYFKNTNENISLIAVFAYMGAPSLEKAGYKRC